MAPKNQWYKHYPLDFYHGTEDLSIEEIGAYQMMLNLIYARQGPVADNDKFIAGHMRVSTRKWRAFRKRLLETGKLFLEDGKLMNVRAQTELENSAKAARRQREHGAKGARTRDENRARANKNKGLNQGSHKQPDKETEENKKVIPPSGTPYGERDAKGEPDLFQPDPPDPEPAPPPETKPKAKRGTRLPENWTPSEADVEYARNLGMSDAEITDAAEEFRNYWIDIPGQRGVKLTWSGTFRNRCRAVVARATGQAGRNRGTGQLSPVQACRELLHENSEKRRLAAGAAAPTPAQAADWPDDHQLRTIEGEATRVRDARVVALRPRSGGDAAGQFGEQDPYPVFQGR